MTGTVTLLAGGTQHSLIGITLAHLDGAPFSETADLNLTANMTFFGSEGPPDPEPATASLLAAGLAGLAAARAGGMPSDTSGGGQVIREWATRGKKWRHVLAAIGLMLVTTDRADAGSFFLDPVSDDGNVALFDVGYDPETGNLLGTWAIDIVASPTAIAVAGTQDDTSILGTGNFPIGNFSDTIRQPEGMRYGNTSLGVNVDVGTTPITFGTLSVTYNGVATEIRSENVLLAGSAIVIPNNTPSVLFTLVPEPSTSLLLATSLAGLAMQRRRLR